MTEGGSRRVWLKGRMQGSSSCYVSAVFLQHRNLVEELNHSKKNCEAIIQAKNRELQQIKVREKMKV